MKRHKRGGKAKTHLRLPPPKEDKSPGIFAVIGHTMTGPTLAPLGKAEIIFRRIDGGEFRVEFADRKFLEIHELSGGRLCVEAVVSNCINVGVHRPLEDE